MTCAWRRVLRLQIPPSGQNAKPRGASATPRKAASPSPVPIPLIVPSRWVVLLSYWRIGQATVRPRR